MGELTKILNAMTADELQEEIAALTIEVTRWQKLARRHDRENLRLEAENARLRGALNHVEWACTPSPAVCVPFCPWCGTIEEEGHRFDCMRQAALEPQKGVGDG